MSLDGMNLKVALTLHPRVISQDAGGSQDIYADVIVERFIKGHDTDGSLLDTCTYHLAVIRQGQIEESMMCKDYDELEGALITNIYGGRELAYGDHWVSINAEKVLHYDALRELVLERHNVIQYKIHLLEGMITKQDHGQGLLAPAMAHMYLQEISDIEQNTYNNATINHED